MLITNHSTSVRPGGQRIAAGRHIGPDARVRRVRIFAELHVITVELHPVYGSGTGRGRGEDHEVGASLDQSVVCGAVIAQVVVCAAGTASCNPWIRVVNEAVSNALLK